MYVVLRLVNRFNADGLLQNPVLCNVYPTKIGNQINAMVCYRRLCCIMYIVLRLVSRLIQMVCYRSLCCITYVVLRLVNKLTLMVCYGVAIGL